MGLRAYVCIYKPPSQDMKELLLLISPQASFPITFESLRRLPPPPELSPLRFLASFAFPWRSYIPEISRSDGEDEGVLMCSSLAVIYMISLSAQTTRLSTMEEEKTEEKYEADFSSSGL
ncbi:hypothetical protein GW17_00036856 [Ensete ventricosum]|nr:hypothetical protein GW17_00036856 [Ensete ventricosum]